MAIFIRTDMPMLEPFKLTSYSTDKISGFTWGGAASTTLYTSTSYVSLTANTDNVVATKRVKAKSRVACYTLLSGTIVTKATTTSLTVTAKLRVDGIVVASDYITDRISSSYTHMRAIHFAFTAILEAGSHIIDLIVNPSVDAELRDLLPIIIYDNVCYEEVALPPARAITSFTTGVNYPTDYVTEIGARTEGTVTSKSISIPATGVIVIVATEWVYGFSAEIGVSHVARLYIEATKVAEDAISTSSNSYFTLEPAFIGLIEPGSYTIYLKHYNGSNSLDRIYRCALNYAIFC
jgi:hypothetical protein